MEKSKVLSSFKNLGQFTINLIHGLVLIPELGIGSAIQKQKGNYITLDNGYLITKLSILPNKSESFDFAMYYNKLIRSSTQMDLYGGHLEKELMSQILKVSGLNKFVCELENEVNQIKTFLMKSLVV